MIKLHKNTKQKKENFHAGDKSHSKLDKLDISLLSRNIINLSEQIKTMTNDVQIKNLLYEKKDN